ncbi:hypothetical protein EMIHUDRAFT_459240 [Emiliania huxleyi CCMP1516]|uniref:EF-hand domain-containing protein n=2 Tax=Emiliania huxleyi TaxID=2903 RepID=A0A0D3IX92_EMIH1|nr:hypothetical protein EMIHUDRAFT_459240 [Emiliania huxleyi CCMP1516]EOD15877.1 hypothetical protein EMIHUDRAFT_459240 [Emiliania huxleyi CCMP1516]|eukprot:XP_005768306.1 hypothetical protein EMIHUDRAFT_459240 [Emiliania huxleyi CCMP1516]
MSMKLAVRVPAGMSPGQTVTFPSTSGGQMFTTVIPVGVEAGQTFVVEVPQQEPPPTPPPDVPMGLPVSPMRSRSLRAPRAPVASTAPLDTATGASPVAPTWQDGQALRHAECPICFEPLASGPVGVFLAGGRRVSNHFFNLGAAQEWLRSGNGHCPLTRLPISSVLAVPDLRADLQAWWRVVDVNGDGRLSRHELIEALKAQPPMRRRLDRSGFIERAEAPGLVAFVQQVFASSGGGKGPIPDMARDKLGWYNYWDEDNSGSLEKEEVVRALVKTLGLSTSPTRVQQMRSTVDAIWAVFDADGSGSIERDDGRARGWQTRSWPPCSTAEGRE